PSGYPALDLPGDDTTVTPTETPTTKPTAPGALDEAELPRVERLKKLWAQAVPDHVAQFGHMDLALGTTGDGITAYLHDDQIPSKSVKRPSGTFAFEVKDDTMIDVPQKVRDVLDFPDRVYELPEVQNPNIPWLGFSTLDVGRELPGGVTITLQEFDGPGDLVTGNVDFTGTINTYLDSRDPESKIHYAKPTHAHQAFWFTEPGAYHATMRYSWGIGADANHRDLSMTFLVGTTWVATGSKVVNNPDLLLQVADTTPEPDTGSTPEPVATTTAAAPGTGSETPGGGKKKEETAVEIGLLDAWAAGSKDLGPALVDTGKKAERAITTVGDFYRKWFIPTPITSAVGGAGTESSPRPAGTNGESTPETTRESTGGTSGSTPRIRRAVPQTSGNATNGARNNSFGGSVAEQDPSAPRTRHSGVPEGAEIVALPAPARGNPSGSAAVNRSTGTATTARTAADEPAADNGRATASEETAAGATPSPQQPAAAQATGGNTPVETAAAVETSSATDSWIKILLGIGVICLIAAAGVLLTVLRKL
ncbi:choice-of-anchor M domain-containing protein, partial [Corynebacterium sp. CCM 8862]